MPPYQNPSRLPAGLSTAENPNSIWAAFPYPDPTKFHWDFLDFKEFNAADWTLTETQAGATQALTDGAGGQLLLTNTAVDDDQISLQKIGEAYRFTPGKRTFFEVRFQVSEAIQVDWYFGLIITDTSVVAGFTDGVFIKKDDGDAQIDFGSLKDSAGVTKTNFATFAAATWTRVGFYYDGQDFWLTFNGQIVSKVAGTVIPDDEDLRITLTLQNGDANARTMLVDGIWVAQER